MEIMNRMLGRIETEPFLGTHLSPMRIFGHVSPDSNRDTLIAVIRRIPLTESEVLITRSGGLFIRPPKELRGFPDIGSLSHTPGGVEANLRARLEFQDKAIEQFNRLLCELALLGLVSEPVSSVHISRGEYWNGHALIASGGGGREAYVERTHMPLTTILTGREWLSWTNMPETVLDEAALQARTAKLAALSSTLPYLIVAAHSHYSRAQWTAALSDSWVVSEQMLGHIWRDHVRVIQNSKRRERLEDTRSYSAAVQIEVLQTAGTLSDAVATELHVARRHRNILAHGAAISQEAATAGMTAMRKMIEHLTGLPVEPAHPNVGVSW